MLLYKTSTPLALAEYSVERMIAKISSCKGSLDCCLTLCSFSG